MVVVSLIAHESSVLDFPNKVSCEIVSSPVQFFQCGKEKQAFLWLQAVVVLHPVVKNLPVPELFSHILIITDLVFDTGISCSR